jgi:hypothetical protein
MIEIEKSVEINRQWETNVANLKELLESQS